MSAKYTYDESGVTFFYYALTIIILVVAPATLSVLFSKKSADAASRPKTPKARARRLGPKSSSAATIKLGLLAVGWLLIFVLTYKVKTTE
ncbi:secretory subunit, partial [Coemansia spiralis]